MVTKPLIDKVGLAAILSEKVAEKVTLVELLMILSVSLSVKLIRVGFELSIVKVMLSVFFDSLHRRTFNVQEAYEEELRKDELGRRSAEAELLNQRPYFRLVT